MDSFAVFFFDARALPLCEAASLFEHWKFFVIVRLKVKMNGLFYPEDSENIRG